MTSDAGSPGAPRFNVVLRGYDRRQVDEHVARLQRVIARMRADLSARNQVGPGFGPQGRPGPQPGPGMSPQPASEPPDAIGGFTDRMQRILQAAEEEAEEIRNRARAGARAEGEQMRAQLDELARQRDLMMRELAQMRGQLPEPDRTARMPRPGVGGPPNEPPRSGMPSPRPRPGPAPGASAPGAPAPGAPTPGAPGGPDQTGPPPPGAPRSSRFDRPASPPLWEISPTRPGGPPADGSPRPPSAGGPAANRPPQSEQPDRTTRPPGAAAEAGAAERTQLKRPTGDQPLARSPFLSAAGEASVQTRAQSSINPDPPSAPPGKPDGPANPVRPGEQPDAALPPFDGSAPRQATGRPAAPPAAKGQTAGPSGTAGQSSIRPAAKGQPAGASKSAAQPVGGLKATGQPGTRPAAPGQPANGAESPGQPPTAPSSSDGSTGRSAPGGTDQPASKSTGQPAGTTGSARQTSGAKPDPKGSGSESAATAPPSADTVLLKPPSHPATAKGDDNPGAEAGSGRNGNRSTSPTR